MRIHDYLVDHDQEIFEALCWIMFPTIMNNNLVGQSPRTLTLIENAELSINCDQAPNRHYITGLNINCEFNSEHYRYYEIDIMINIPTLPCIELYGKMYSHNQGKLPWEENDFMILDWCFKYFAEHSHLPRSDIHTSEYNRFVNWLTEIKHHATLARIMI